jgi:hypothetical protein
MTPDDYRDVLEDCGGEATTAQIVEKTGRDGSTVRRMLKKAEGIECQKIGSSLLHSIQSEEDSDDDV